MRSRLRRHPAIILRELAEGIPHVTDGMVEIPDRAGLGVTMDNDFVKRYAIR